MTSITNIPVRKLIRQISVSALFVVIVVLAFASKGGGGDKKKNAPLKNDFTPIRTLNEFTLKSKPFYSGSYVFGQQRDNNGISLNTIVTYQKGRTVYVLPFKYKVNTISLSNSPKTNLQFIGVKIKMSK
jgi:hypothetical protein